MPETTVRCHQLKKSFADVPVVNNVTFTVATGTTLALLGPSGCGKTTTLRLIAGFEQLDDGWIEIAGQIVADASSHTPPEKRRVGMVFQDYAIFPHLSVGKNVGFGLKRGAEAAARTQALLELVGLGESGEKMPHELSGGQQQRVALARALVMEPAVLLLDEPFSNLDTALRTQVRVEVRDLLRRSQATAIFVTHDQEEAMFVGDRVAVMHEGRIEQLGTPEEIFHRPATRFVAEFMGQSDFLPGAVSENSIVTAIGSLPQTATVRAGTPVEILIRPDDIDLTPARAENSNGQIRARQFAGIDYIYHIVLHDGTWLRSRQPHTHQLAEGESVAVSFTDEHPLACFFENQRVSP